MPGPYPLPPDKHGEPRWRIFVDAGPDAVTGKRRQVTKTVRGTKKEAELALARLTVESGDGRLAGTDDVTLGELLERYCTHKALSTAGSTTDTYRYQLTYITDHLAKMPVTKVRAQDLDALYGHLAARGNKRTGEGLSAKSIRNVHVVLHGAFELARRYGWVAVNPAANAEPPTVGRRLPSPAPAAAIDALFRAAAAEHAALPTYLRVTLCAGGRRSEIHGLRWSSIDFTTGQVMLRDVIVRAGKEWVVKPYTKTGGERPVLVDPGTLDLLRALHDRAFEMALACGVALSADAFVFTDDPLGSKPWVPVTTARRFSRACATVGLPAKTRLHDLRHLMATHLIDQGVPVTVVSARLGHAQSSTTLDIYTARVAESDQGAADVMGRFFDGG